MATKKNLNTKGTRGQDLAAARAELKAFRHDVSILRKKGLLDKTIYDARSATPTKYLKSQLKKFASVLTGEATPIKVSKAKATYYREKGLTVKSGKVIVPHVKGEKVMPKRGDFMKVMRGKGGKITVVDLGVRVDNMGDFIKALRNESVKVGRDQQLAAQIFGWNVKKAFAWRRRPGGGWMSPQEQMADYMERYQKEDDRGAEHAEEFVEGIDLITVSRDSETGAFPWIDHNEERHKQDSESRRRYNEWKRTRYQTNLGRMTPAQLNRRADERAAAEKQRRANMSDAEKAVYKERSKKRAAAARAKKKK
jgi:hypothetical protein